MLRKHGVVGSNPITSTKEMIESQVIMLDLRRLERGGDLFKSGISQKF